MPSTWGLDHVILSNIVVLEALSTADPTGTPTGCHGDGAGIVVSHRAKRVSPDVTMTTKE